MSKFSDYEKENLNFNNTAESPRHLNFSDLDPNGELGKQLTALRKKDRVRMLILGVAAGLMLSIGVGFYMADAKVNPADAGSTYGVPAGYNASNAIFGGSGFGGGGGGGCGMSGGGIAGGGCNMNGGALSGVSLPDLEKQALDEYTTETGATDVTAKAGDFGCHIQIDISDKAGKIIRSYGFQGGPLYVIN